MRACSDFHQQQAQSQRSRFPFLLSPSFTLSWSSHPLSQEETLCPPLHPSLTVLPHSHSLTRSHTFPFLCFLEASHLSHPTPFPVPLSASPTPRVHQTPGVPPPLLKSRDPPRDPQCSQSSAIVFKASLSSRILIGALPWVGEEGFPSRTSSLAQRPHPPESLRRLYKESWGFFRTVGFSLAAARCQGFATVPGTWARRPERLEARHLEAAERKRRWQR